jgi:polar amino acid transport system substrate-binding protein
MESLVAGDERREIGDETAHLAFPLTTITNQIYKIRSGTVGFDVTTPYFVAHQRLLVPVSSDIEDVDDLGGRKVCSLVDPEVGVPVEELAPDAEVYDVSTTTECAVALKKGTVDAAVADEVLLLGVLSELDERDDASNYEIVGEQTTTQGYSPLVVRGMAAFASDVLNDVKDDGRWAEAHAEWIAPLTGDEAIAADLTLEEAAALYPEVTPPPGSEDET